MIDVACGWSFDLKSPDEALQVLETMAASSANMHNDRQNRKGGVLAVNVVDTLIAQNMVISQ